MLVKRNATLNYEFFVAPLNEAALPLPGSSQKIHGSELRFFWPALYMHSDFLDLVAIWHQKRFTDEWYVKLFWMQSISSFQFKKWSTWKQPWSLWDRNQFLVPPLPKTDSRIVFLFRNILKYVKYYTKRMMVTLFLSGLQPNLHEIWHEGGP